MSQAGIKDEFESEAYSKVGIQILFDDPKGHSVRLRNYHRKDVSIAGWSLARILTGESHQDTTYRFPDGSKIPGKGFLTVWSSNIPEGTTSEPPHNVIMKNQDWHVSNHFKTILFDSIGKEAAVRESKRVAINPLGQPSEISESRQLIMESTKDQKQYWKHRCSIS